MKRNFQKKKAADDGELAKLSRFFHQISLTEWKKKKEFTLMNKKKPTKKKLI